MTPGDRKAYPLALIDEVHRAFRLPFQSAVGFQQQQRHAVRVADCGVGTSFPLQTQQQDYASSSGDDEEGQGLFSAGDRASVALDGEDQTVNQTQLPFASSYNSAGSGGEEDTSIGETAVAHDVRCRHASPRFLQVLRPVHGEPPVKANQSSVHLLGVIRAVFLNWASKVGFVLDDGSATIVCVWWYPLPYDYPELKIGRQVRVLGRAKTYQSRLQIEADHVVEERDESAESWHYLQIYSNRLDKKVTD